MMSEEQTKLVIENQRLISLMIKKLKIKWDYEELLEIGMIGLCKGALWYDPTKGYTVSTYLSKCIANELLMHLRKISKPTYKAISLDENITDTDNLTLLDVLEDKRVNIERETEQTLLAIEINKLLSKLDEKERSIIVHKYELNGAKRLTQDEVAVALGISQSYVSRIEKRALKKLRKFMEED